MAKLVGQGPIAAVGQTSDVQTTPYTPQLGSKAVDVDGNVYVLVDMTGTFYSGCLVQILDDYTAAAAGTTGRGACGITVSSGTSDNAAWVQIYGKVQVQLGASGPSPSDAANGPTTLDTSAATKFILATSATTPATGISWVSDPSSLDGKYMISGMRVADSFDPTSYVTNGATSATSATGNRCLVFLNYPSIEYVEAGGIST